MTLIHHQTTTCCVGCIDSPGGVRFIHHRSSLPRRLALGDLPVARGTAGCLVLEKIKNGVVDS